MHSAYEIQHDILPEIRRQILAANDPRTTQDAMFTLLAFTEELAGLLYGLLENLGAESA